MSPSTLIAYVGFSTPKRFNPISWLVRKITKSEVSHAWVQFFDPLFNRDMVFEAMELEFRCIPLEHFEMSNKIVQRIPVDVDFTTGARYLANKLGNTYDYGGLLGMGWVELCRWLKHRLRWWHFKITNPLHWANDDFCSAAVINSLLVCNSRMVEGMIPDTVSPQELRDALNGKT
jgi:hypothetical protein